MAEFLLRPNAETQPFWDACMHDRLVYQCCTRCVKVQAIPRSLCCACQSRALDWKQSAGSGTVLTHTTVHRAPTPAFKAMLPYVIAIVDMDEGFRLMVNVRTGIGSQVAIGSRVRLGVTQGDGMKLPQIQEVL